MSNMTGKDNYTLPAWRKISLKSNREIPDNDLENILSVIVLELKDKESCDLIIKLRAANDHDTNMKILNAADVQRVKTVLEELGGKTEGLNKEGICLSILREVLKRLPHKCVDCKKVVNFDPSAPVFTLCIACGIQLCTKCYQGNYNNVVCNPCSSWIGERYTIPKELFRKNHMKKVESSPLLVTEDSKDEDPSNDEDTLGETLPCAQPRAESTIVEPVIRRGGSILNDTTIVDKTVIANPVLEQTVVNNVTPMHLSSTPPEETDPKEVCKFFLKGCCKHGYKGTVEKDGVAKCRFLHPSLCKRYMDHGDSPSGCSKGNNCERTHVTLCLESVEHKVCSSSIAGKRCKYGYHVKGTKSLNPNTPPVEGRSINSTTVVGQSVKKNTAPKAKESRINDNSDNIDSGECETDTNSDVVKTFLVSMVKLLSGLKTEKKVMVKERKDPNQELIQSLATLLN